MNTSRKNCPLDKTETATIKYCFANKFSYQKTGYSKLHSEIHLFRY